MDTDQALAAMHRAMKRAATTEALRVTRLNWTLNAIAQTAPLFGLLILIEGFMGTPSFSWACQSPFLQPDVWSMLPAGLCFVVSLIARLAGDTMERASEPFLFRRCLNWHVDSSGRSANA